VITKPFLELFSSLVIMEKQGVANLSNAAFG
jgi:hypothetical protein